MNEITINWHIIQKCNYKCYYCFAKYKKTKRKEIHNSKKDIEICLHRLYDFFRKEYVGYSIRLNIAGGEPTLSKNLGFIIKKAREIGFNVSIITNSSKLTSNFIETYAKYISMYATSIDSTSNLNNTNIGRISKDIPIKISQIIKHIELFKEINKNIQIKINTVINEYNYKEDMGNFIDFIKPNKWKVLQALSFDADKVYCSDEQFNIFIDNHQNINTKIFKESNNDMTDSYIMIDPYGRFYQNSNSTYNYSSSILDTNIKEAFTSIDFDIEKFMRRY